VGLGYDLVVDIGNLYMEIKEQILENIKKSVESNHDATDALAWIRVYEEFSRVKSECAIKG
jgi:predicted transcriptional regulator